MLSSAEPAQLQCREESMVMKCHNEFQHYVETLTLPGSVRLKKSALLYSLSHLVPTFVSHNAGPQGVKCSEWSSPLDIMCAPRCCQNDLAATWCEVPNVTWAFSQQSESTGSGSCLPEKHPPAKRQGFSKPMLTISCLWNNTNTWTQFICPPMHLFLRPHPSLSSCQTRSRVHMFRSIKLRAQAHLSHATSWLMAPPAAL